ncbi:MAG: sigma-70 family RNA polymerase sigma factor [Gemmatimonadales bacterium]|nr:MAG: sigma-70 family RNA polymerase sigma factor [Gemmatimonadales bacterium]
MDKPDLSPRPMAAPEGDREAVDQLFAVTYEELKVLAHLHRRRWNGNPTLGTTVLVHEAYQKLSLRGSVNPRDRSHFLAVAAQAMRQVLVNYAERQAATKRGGGVAALSLDEANPVAPDVAEEVLALNRALQELARAEPRKAQVVECRFFAGMTIEETAEALGISPATVKRDWVLATAWLRREILALGGEPLPPSRERGAAPA